MADEERLVAEQTVPLHEGQQMHVTISQSPAEAFWRVQVSNPHTVHGHLSTTVATGDSFLMHLIDDAVGGNQLAWHHLAQWGQANLTRPGPGRAVYA